MKTRKSVVAVITALLCILLMSMTASAKSSTVATIGSKKYTSLSTAFKKVKKGETIVLKQNVTVTKPLTLTRNVNFTLDLNKKTITFKNKNTASNSIFIGLRISKGNITIKNGTMRQTYVKGELIWVEKKASVTIKNGTYIGVIENSGKMTIDKGSFRTFSDLEKAEWYGYIMLINTGTMTVNGGNFSTKCCYLLGNLDLESRAKLTVNGGTFKQSRAFNSDIEGCEFNNGALLLINATSKNSTTVNGGEFTSNVPVFLAEKGTVKVKKGTFIAKEGATMALTGKANATVNGGTWSISSCRPNFILLGSSRVTVNNGTFKSECTTVEASESSTCTIKGGKFSTTMNDSSIGMLYLGGSSKITVTGGTFTGKKTCAYVKLDPAASIKVRGGNFKVKKTKASQSVS